jgi:precorrin-2 dehydrogenase/sirohydrochlorin ferrochelatase
MKYYPVNLDINDRNCLVVGGGSVGTRKVRTLIKCNANVTVVSPEFEENLMLLADKHSITLKKRPYRPTDLNNMFLVISATCDLKLNRLISQEARERNMLCNIADFPDACSFILPSIVNRGDLLISISTSGKSPAFAKKLRKDLEKQFGKEYGDFLRLMGAIRKKLLGENHHPEAHKNIFQQIIEQDLLDMIRMRKKENIDSLLLGILGHGYSYDELMG